MNTPRLFICMALIASCCIFSAGCSQPTIGLVIASQPNVNPDHSGRPSPVIVKMYELRNDLAFKQADFRSLFDTPIQVLGADLIATDEIVLIPGEARRVLYHPNLNTSFVGILAGFRQMDRSLWRVIKAVDPEDDTWLAMELNDASILVLPESEAEDWDPEEAVRQFQRQAAKPQVQHTPGEAGTAASGTENAVTQSPASSPVVQGPPEQPKEVITVIDPDGVETTQF